LSKSELDFWISVAPYFQSHRTWEGEDKRW